MKRDNILEIGIDDQGRLFIKPDKERFAKVTPLSVIQVHSTFFEDRERFPEGSITFDNALLMKNIRHEWRSLGSPFS